MKQKNWVLAALLGGLALASQGCITIMPKQSVHEFANGIKGTAKEAADHAQEALGIAKGARAASSTPDAPPYAELAQDAQQMIAAAAEMQPSVARAADLSGKFDVLAKGRNEIHSDWPEWDQAKGIQDSLMGLQSPLEAARDHYMAAQKKFSDLAGQYKVGTLDVGDLRKELKNMAGKIPSIVDAARKALAGARKQLKEMGQEGLGPDHYRRLNNGLTEIGGILDQISAQWPIFESKAKALLMHDGAQAQLYQGPGIPPVAGLDDLAKAGNKLRSLVDHYNNAKDKLK